MKNGYKVYTCGVYFFDFEITLSGTNLTKEKAFALAEKLKNNPKGKKVYVVAPSKQEKFLADMTAKQERVRNEIRAKECPKVEFSAVGVKGKVYFSQCYFHATRL
jgi:hypothetical protein